MSIAEALLPKFDQEMARTRKILEAVPTDKFDWKPHEKSMALGRLANHLTELPGWSEALLVQNEFDVAPTNEGEQQSPPTFDTTTELLEAFDTNVAKTREVIAATSDEQMMAPWSLKSGGETLFTAPRIGIVETFMIHHIIHHRGQMTVYLRLCDCPVPQTYGPSADYPEF